ncbi:hypothetical protein [Microcystis aeruginosa]|nr:hypothetical protein [Microcystis aeruginosa]
MISTTRVRNVGIISRILQLSPEEFTPLLLQYSKQELLKRFPPEKSREN